MTKEDKEFNRIEREASLRNEVLRVTADGEFIWHPEADALIEKGDFTSSPAMQHILRALRKSLAAPVQEENSYDLAVKADNGGQP